MDRNAPAPPREITLGPLGHDLVFMLSTVQSLLRPEGQAIRSAAGVEPGAIGVLLIIWQNPGISQNDLAASVVLKKSAVTALVKSLEAQGLIARRRHDRDRRVNALTLTPEGAALVRRVRVLTGAMEDRLFDGVPEAERAAFFAVLARLLDRLAAA